MGRRVYENKNVDINSLVRSLEQWFINQSYIVESNYSEGVWAVQAKKEETWRKALGASRAYKVTVIGESNNFTVDVGTGEWASNLTAVGVGAILTGGISVIGSGIATGWSKKIEGDILAYLDDLVLFGEKEKQGEEKIKSSLESSMKEKLEKLREAYDNGILDEKDYKIKTQEIENQFKLESKNINKEKQLEKLKSSYEAGILTLAEYETKKAELHKVDLGSKLEDQISILRVALANGILQQEEFDRKKQVLEKEYNLKVEIKKLEEALYAGLINRDQFEQKKIEVMNKNMDNDEKIKSLEIALENGIISQEEFDAKKKALEEEPIIKEKLKKLEAALHAGIINQEEFEAKKSVIVF